MGLIMAANNGSNTSIHRIKGKAKKDILKGTKNKDLIMGMAGNDIIRAQSSNDTLMGGAGNDTLNGGKGKDVLNGEKGNDTYIINDLLDKIREKAGQGTDTVRASVNYVLGNNLENLILEGTTNLNGTGNDLNNTIAGNSGNNVLLGGAGNDTIDGGAGNDTIDGNSGVDIMKGGLGDDLFYVDNAADIVIEEVNSGFDKVITTVSTYAKPLNVEQIEYIGNSNFVANVGTTSGSPGSGSQVTSGSGNDKITSGSGNDKITSGAGNDTLDGGAGDDTLDGGAGDDTLDGGTGIDTLLGGLGDDLYLVDNIADKVQELLNSGLDTVKSTVDYVLQDNLEVLELLGSAVSGTGNALDNLIKGTDGNNLLNGGAGVDELIGGLGDDTYLVDNLADKVSEALNAGIDTIKSTVDYMLGANQENLELLDAAITGIGNDLANTILGSAADNILNGGAGEDTLLGGLGNDKLIGGAGIDQLTGGAGIDTFALLETATNGLADTITDFDAVNDILALKESNFGPLQSALGLVDGVTKTLNIGSDGIVGTVLNTVSPYLIYDAATGQLKLDGNGSLLPGLGNGGVLATLKDATGNAPALSTLTVMLDSALNSIT